MNKLDLDYQNLLKDILENGITKETRNGNTTSVFGRQIRHNMKDGFPLLTTKKMPFKTIVTELLWFLRADTNIKYLVDNNCHIWDGDCYSNYCKQWAKYPSKGIFNPNEYSSPTEHEAVRFTQEEFINKIKTDDEFAKKWGELGPIYGKQWRSWKFTDKFTNGEQIAYVNGKIDQIQNLINDLKTNPDSRRLMVNAWNVGELDQMVLPPCHFSFQVYTRELSLEERLCIADKFNPLIREDCLTKTHHPDETEELKLVYRHKFLDSLGPNVVPQRRAISLMWNQRSVDTFLGLPFNIASYGLLLEIIAKAVNMVPDELIGNLGDVHLYSNHIEQAKEQIGRELTLEERKKIYEEEYANGVEVQNDSWLESKLKTRNIPKRTREPYPLPKLTINTEFWPTESGECGIGLLDARAIFDGFKGEHFCKCLLEEDIQLSNYKSHPTIKAPLSN
jgi:thymidylate synthase